MNKSEQIGELAAALAIAQGAIQPVERNREVKVKLKAGGEYGFSYATMDAIVDAIREPLSTNGISWVQGVDGSTNGTIVETLIMHKSGQWFSTVTPVRIDGSGAQAVGSGITYAKRYGLTAALGIVTEDDDDGNEADGNERKIIKRPQSNRSDKDPNWTGPLGKSALKDQMRQFGRDLEDVSDDGAAWGLLNSSKDILAQCARDLPEWWVNKIEGNHGGAKVAIAKCGTQLGVSFSKYLDEIERMPITQQAAE